MKLNEAHFWKAWAITIASGATVAPTATYGWFSIAGYHGTPLSDFVLDTEYALMIMFILTMATAVPAAVGRFIIITIYNRTGTLNYAINAIVAAGIALPLINAMLSNLLPIEYTAPDPSAQEQFERTLFIGIAGFSAICGSFLGTHYLKRIKNAHI